MAVINREYSDQEKTPWYSSVNWPAASFRLTLTEIYETTSVHC